MNSFYDIRIFPIIFKNRNCVTTVFSIRFQEWSKFEKIWFCIFSIVILCTTIIFSYEGTDYKETFSIILNWFISPISALTGILCVVLAAKAKISTWTYGAVNSIFYGCVAWYSGYYGDFLINIFYFLPSQFIGLYYWRRHLKPLSKVDVTIKKISKKSFLAILVSCILLAVLWGLFLHYVDSWFTNVMKRNISIYGDLAGIFGPAYTLLGPMLDSSTEILQLAGQLLMILALPQQWIFWIATNVITILMWTAVLLVNPGSAAWAVPTLVMWIAYLINSIYGCYNWNRRLS